MTRIEASRQQQATGSMPAVFLSRTIKAPFPFPRPSIVGLVP